MKRGKKNARRTQEERKKREEREAKDRLARECYIDLKGYTIDGLVSKDGTIRDAKISAMVEKKMKCEHKGLFRWHTVCEDANYAVKKCNSCNRELD